MDIILNFIIILIIVFSFNYVGQKFINHLKINWPVLFIYTLLQSVIIALLLTFVF